MRFAFRQLWKSPGFTAVAVLTLALGIGANTAIFSLIDHVMLRFLPVREPEALATMPGHYSYPQFLRFRDLNQVFSHILGAHALPNMELTASGDQPITVRGALVTGSYFETLGVPALLGRTLGTDDDRGPESSPVAVISHTFWKRTFAGAPDVIGKKIRVRSAPGYAGTAGLNIYEGADPLRAGAVLTIVGVGPPDFFGETVGISTDVWIPIQMEPAVMPGRPWLDKVNVSWVTMMGRRKAGVTEEQASAALTVLWRQLQTEAAGDNLTPDRQAAIARTSILLEPGGKGFSHLRRQYSQPLKILMAVAGLVLLIACLNVANLLLARGSARRQELAVKLALGAGRWRLIRQWLGESMILGMLGGAVGLLLAMSGTRVLVTMVSGGYQSIQLPIRPDLRTLAFTAVVSLLTTIAFGLAPAIHATRMRIADTMKVAGWGSANRAGGRGRRALVCLQVAMSVVLLVTAGLFLKTLVNLRYQNVGYDPERLVMMHLDPVSAGYRGEGIGRVCQAIMDRIAVMPGVRAATFSENGLFFGPESRTKIDIEGFTPGTEADRRSCFDQIGPGYFSRVGIPLLRGRDMSERDGPGAPRVAIINQTMADFYFPGRDPVGQHLISLLEPPTRLEIVGVARDVQDHNFWAKPVRRFYVSFYQPIDGVTAANFAIRTTGPVGNLAALLRREVQQVDRSLMVLGIREVTTLMDQSLVQERLIARLSAFFGLLAVSLAAIGLYGLMSYEVVGRTKEIGVRMALGAQRSAVLGLILGDGLRLTLLGVAFGLGGAVACTRLIQSQLWGVQGFTPTAFLAAAFSLIGVTLLACWLPARRATKIEPVEALRRGF